MIIHCAIGYRAERKRRNMDAYTLVAVVLLVIAAVLIGIVVGIAFESWWL